MIMFFLGALVGPVVLIVGCNFVDWVQYSELMPWNMHNRVSSLSQMMTPVWEDYVQRQADKTVKRSRRTTDKVS